MLRISYSVSGGPLGKLPLRLSISCTAFQPSIALAYAMLTGVQSGERVADIYKSRAAAAVVIIPYERLEYAYAQLPRLDPIAAI